MSEGLVVFLAGSVTAVILEGLVAAFSCFAREVAFPFFECNGPRFYGGLSSEKA
jgi:hypothetical protein